jgi:hypothetical protein
MFASDPTWVKDCSLLAIVCFMAAAGGIVYGVGAWLFRDWRK